MNAMCNCFPIECQHIFSFAQFLHYGLHINIVVIGELLWRDPMRVHSEYNKNVTDTNSALYKVLFKVGTFYNSTTSQILIIDRYYQGYYWHARLHS
jgi:hypothetical protein